MTPAELAVHDLARALADQREAAALVERFRRARLDHTHGAAGARAVLASCNAVVAHRLARVTAVLSPERIALHALVAAA